MPQRQPENSKRNGMKIAKWIGVLAAQLYQDQCMDLGGGANHPDAGASFPICVLDVETYRQRHAR